MNILIFSVFILFTCKLLIFHLGLYFHNLIYSYLLLYLYNKILNYIFKSSNLLNIYYMINKGLYIGNDIDLNIQYKNLIY